MTIVDVGNDLVATEFFNRTEAGEYDAVQATGIGIDVGGCAFRCTIRPAEQINRQWPFDCLSCSNNPAPLTRSRICTPSKRAIHTSGMPSTVERSLLMTESRNALSLRQAMAKLRLGVDQQKTMALFCRHVEIFCAYADETASIGKPSTQCTGR